MYASDTYSKMFNAHEWPNYSWRKYVEKQKFIVSNEILHKMKIPNESIREKREKKRGEDKKTNGKRKDFILQKLFTSNTFNGYVVRMVRMATASFLCSTKNDKGHTHTYTKTTFPNRLNFLKCNLQTCTIFHLSFEFWMRCQLAVLIRALCTSLFESFLLWFLFMTTLHIHIIETARCE